MSAYNVQEEFFIPVLYNKSKSCLPPHNTLEQTANLNRTRVTIFQFFIVLFFTYPKTQGIKKGFQYPAYKNRVSDHIRAKAVSLTRPFHVQMSQKSLQFKP